jgi:hypothetical protein
VVVGLVKAAIRGTQCLGCGAYAAWCGLGLCVTVLLRLCGACLAGGGWCGRAWLLLAGAHCHCCAAVAAGGVPGLILLMHGGRSLRLLLSAVCRPEQQANRACCWLLRWCGWSAISTVNQLGALHSHCFGSDRILVQL